MLSAIKQYTFKLLIALNVPKHAHRLLFKHNISIIMYHGVCEKQPELFDWCMMDAETFRTQIKYLKTHFTIVPLSEVANSLDNDSFEKPIAALTFDDGYQNNFDVVFPILQEENIPATIFLTSNFIDTDKSIWTGELYHIFDRTNHKSITWRDQVFSIRNNQEKLKASQEIKQQLKREPSKIVTAEIRCIADALGVTDLSIEDGHPFRMLNSASIKKMLVSGIIEFGAHTASHCILSNLDKTEQRREIESSIQKIRSITGRPCRFFAYPNGTISDYNTETKNIVKTFNLIAAVTTTENLCTKDSPRLEWPRLSIGSGMDMATFIMTVHGLYTKLKLR